MALKESCISLWVLGCVFLRFSSQTSCAYRTLSLPQFDWAVSVGSNMQQDVDMCLESQRQHAFVSKTHFTRETGTKKHGGRTWTCMSRRAAPPCLRTFTAETPIQKLTIISLPHGCPPYVFPRVLNGPLEAQPSSQTYLLRTSLPAAIRHGRLGGYF